MLFKKMMRDIKSNLSQFITIFLMVFIGVMAYVGIEAYMDGMTETGDKFYSKNNLQDLDVLSTNFDTESLNKVKEIDGVVDAERKLSIIAKTTNDNTLLLNFIESNNISKFYVYSGIQFDTKKSGIWLDNFYAIENNLKVGDKITVKYDGVEFIEEILGLINVPDHLYDVKDPSELYPDHNTFGFAYMSISELKQKYIKEKYDISDDNLLDNYVIYNYLMVDIDKKENVDVVKRKIEEKLDNVLLITKIEDSISYTTYQGEIDEGKTYVGVFSGLFLFIAMLSVITTMTRVVKKQRIQIGTLKALGYKDYRILFHYIGYGFYISLIAAICGIIAGYFLIGKLFISLEMAFFEIPNGHPVVNFNSYVVSIVVVLVVSIITYFTCKKILKENPAETLRNKIPNVKKNSLNITTKGIFNKLRFSSKWNIRDIIRNKLRTIMGVVGVSSCAMLIVCAFGMLDSMNYFIDLQFEQLYNFDYKLTLKNNITDDELKSLLDKYGNKTSESFDIEIIDENNNRESNEIFVTDASNYVRFVDDKGRFTDITSDNGIYVTYKLAKLNNYKIGDIITWHIYGRDEYYKSKIVGFNKDPQNQIITMTRNYLESDEVGLTYKPDSVYTNHDLSDVNEIKGVELIQDITSLKEGMTKMLSMMKTMLVLIISIAILLGAIIIYNLGILSYTEKQYQFATLKVLGFNDKKIKKIFIKQNNWIAIFSIIIGLPLGYYLTDWLFKTAIEEHYDFGASINLSTYFIAAIGTFIVSYIVSLFLSRKVEKIDMVTSLKGNE